MDANREIRRAVDTGKVIIGAKRTEKQIYDGKIQMIIFAENCPKDIKREISNNSKLKEVSTHTVELSSMKLGELCGKPFPIAVLSVMDPGNSKVLKVIG